MVETELVSQTSNTFGHGDHPSADRGDMMANRQIDSLDERGVDEPPPGGQDVHDLSQGPEHHPWTHADQAPAPILFDDLGIQQLRLWQPAWLRGWPFGLTVRGLYPGECSGFRADKHVRQSYTAP
jgi:hypothetical protein